MLWEPTNINIAAIFKRNGCDILRQVLYVASVVKMIDHFRRRWYIDWYRIHVSAPFDRK